MKNTLSMLACAVSLAAWGAAAAVVGHAGPPGRDRGLSVKRTPAAASDARAVECTFSNPAHAGSCTETASASGAQTPEQACQPILDCLNDARCVKTYCGSTTVRGGWKLESAKPKEE